MRRGPLRSPLVQTADSRDETAVEGVRFSLRVLQARQARTHEAGKLVRIGRFLGEDVSRTGETLKRRFEHSCDARVFCPGAL